MKRRNPFSHEDENQAKHRDGVEKLEIHAHGIFFKK